MIILWTRGWTGKFDDLSFIIKWIICWRRSSKMETTSNLKHSYPDWNRLDYVTRFTNLISNNLMIIWLNGRLSLDNRLSDLIKWLVKTDKRGLVIKSLDPAWDRPREPLVEVNGLRKAHTKNRVHVCRSRGVWKWTGKVFSQTFFGLCIPMHSKRRRFRLHMRQQNAIYSMSGRNLQSFWTSAFPF